MNQKIRIELKSYNRKLINKAIEKIKETVKPTKATVKESVPLPPLSKRMLDICYSTPKTIDVLMKLDLPDRIKVKIKVKDITT
jgi:small subunit ribosomal protein S10